LFGLKRRIAGRLRIDLDLDVGDVGRGVDRQLLETPDADDGRHEDERQHDPAMPDRQADDAFKHGDASP